jgi:hypothetical protein
VSVLFIGSQFSNPYTAVDTPAMGRVGEFITYSNFVFAARNRIKKDY